jgi:RNA polymerase sigma-70 factor (ECF subfamily)
VIQPNARAAWQELEGQLRPFVARRLSQSADVDDVLQDIYLRIQAGVGQLRDVDRFGPWVYRIARSALADHGRSRARHPLPVGDPAQLETAAAQSDAPEDGDGIAEQGLAQNLAVFVAALPSPYREAITLTELQGVTQKDAADMLGISPSGMKSRVQRGRQQIRDMLQACCEIALDGRGRVLSYDRRPDGKVPDKCCDVMKKCECESGALVQRDTSAFVLRPAVAADESAIRALLESAKLPFEDVATSRQDFIVAISGGQVVGCAALETFGDAALLRSLAVSEEVRGAGLGDVLCARIVARAKEKGLRRLFLLTTTAAPFFASRGFQPVDRSKASEAMTKSAQFASLCPSTATCMVFVL